MKKNIVLALAALAIFLCQGNVFAKAKLSDVSDKVSVDAQVRLRPEFRKDLTQANPNVPGAREEDLSVLLRSRLGLGFEPTENLKFYLQMQDAREFGEEAPGLPTAAGDDEGVDLHQAYIDYANINDSGFSLRVGRQEVSLGEERLVGAVDWSNVGRSLDGFVLAYDSENWWVGALGTMLNKTAAGDQTWVGGLYSTWKHFPSGVLDLYYIALLDNDAAAGAPAGTGNNLSLHSVGSRIRSNPGKWSFGAEGVLQTGKFGSNTIFAYAGHGDAGYTFVDTWKPKLMVEYNYASGDDGANNRYTKFNQLIPTEHNKYGYMDLAVWSNLHNGRVEFSCQPSDKWKLSVDYHLFMVDKNSAGDTFAGIAGGVGTSKLAGHEGNLQLGYTWNEYASFLLGYGHFIPGQFLKSQGMNKQVDFGYLQAVASF